MTMRRNYIRITSPQPQRRIPTQSVLCFDFRVSRHSSTFISFVCFVFSHMLQQLRILMQYNCLALGALASVASGEEGSELTEEIFQLLMKSESNFVRKKAALCLTQMLRQETGKLVGKEIDCDTLMSVFEVEEVGVLQSLTILLRQYVVTCEPVDAVQKNIMFHTIQLLSKLVVYDGFENDEYHGVKGLWLQVSCFQLLAALNVIGTLGGDAETESEQKLTKQLNEVLNQMLSPTQNYDASYRRGFYAIFYEMLQVAKKLSGNLQLMQDIAVFISESMPYTINAREEHVLYYALKIMAEVTEAGEDVLSKVTIDDEFANVLDSENLNTHMLFFDVLNKLCASDQDREELETLRIKLVEIDVVDDMFLDSLMASVQPIVERVIESKTTAEE
eukprot:TRINITY_DN1575_c0_g1_i4.p1 TRINITY_DN1575_c0_g1~~TRINITY_DN1575_c0_g1_i4.p1  ORF type:complete len:390 (+),score=134.40 TRINITY_DN1575_c0_g1_i4:157-1326(+)